MKISQEGLDAIVKREGSRKASYLDTKGIWTIGVGHTGPEVHSGLMWTIQQIEDALREDIKEAEDCINEVVKASLKQNQFDALCSFIFNVGVAAFKKSTMLKLINLCLYAQAGQQFDRWIVPPEITGRRMSEKEQFLK